MAKKIYMGVDGVAREVYAPYIGVDGVARTTISGYVGVDGVARQFFQLGDRWEKYSVKYSAKTSASHTVTADKNTVSGWSDISNITSSYKLHVYYSTSYSLQNGEFVLSSPTYAYGACEDKVLTTVSAGQTLYFTAKRLRSNVSTPDANDDTLYVITVPSNANYTIQLALVEYDGYALLRTTCQTDGNSYKYTLKTLTVSTSKNSLIGTVIAPTGTYPDNGIQDGYWYVKIS